MKRSSSMLFIVLILLVMAFGVVMSGGSKSVQTQPDYTHITPLPSNAEIGTYAAPNASTTGSTTFEQQNLQLQQFGYITPSPEPTILPTTAEQQTEPSSPVILIGGQQPGVCSPDGPRENCTCPEPWGMPVNVCASLSADECKSQGGSFLFTAPSFALNKCTFGASETGPVPSGCKAYCIAKPVIYLYPQKDTGVTVTLGASETIVTSDPPYPPQGWQHILAHPDGSFLYKNMLYHELFYETAPAVINAPRNGIVIPVLKLTETLTKLTNQLGLLPKEQQEFIAFWLPRLYALKSPYIFFSVLDQNEKERTDHLAITPQPDTMIAFIAYFKPMNTNDSILPLLFLPQRPMRNGFTVVEWGGVIDHHTTE